LQNSTEPVAGRRLSLGIARIGDRLAGRRADVLIATAVIALVAVPMLVRAVESADYVNYLWLAWVAGKETVAAGHPVLFMHTAADGPFYPIFAFYGGTLFVATGLLGQLLDGQIAIAYSAVWVLGVASAYLGTLWLARQIGVRGLIAHGPAICVVTSAYYITNLYARADYPEFIAVSMVPTLAASGLWLVRAPRWRTGPVLIFAIAGVVLTGSHNLTLLWTATFALVGLLLVALVRGLPRRLPARRLAMVAGLGLASLCVNGWFLLTDITHGHSVRIGTSPSTAQTGANTYLDSLGTLLNPFRYNPPQLSSRLFPIYIRSFYVDAPIWFLAWGGLAGAFVLWRSPAARRLVLRYWAGGLVLVGLFVWLIATPAWSSFPYPWADTQFPYRVNSYLVFAIALVVLSASLALQHARTSELGQWARHALRGSLLAAVAVSVALCLWQELVPATDNWFYVSPDAQLSSIHMLPQTWYAPADYANDQGPFMPVYGGRILWVPWNRISGDSFSGWLPAPPGFGAIETNVLAGDYVVQFSGMRWLGTVATGQQVVQRLTNSSGRVHVEISTAPTRAVRYGRILSVLGLATILLTVLYTLAAPRLAARRGIAA
jgi:hypothetical protein